MATIYKAPSSIPLPKLDFKKMGEYEKACDKYMADLKAFLLKRKQGEYIGKTIRIPMADSYAEYMVMSLKPVELVHINLMDGWDSAMAHLMTAKHIKDTIDREEAFAKIWEEANKKKVGDTVIISINLDDHVGYTGEQLTVTRALKDNYFIVTNEHGKAWTARNEELRKVNKKK